MSGVLAVAVATSPVRSALVEADGTVHSVRRQAVLPRSPAPGLVELDPPAIAEAILSTASALASHAGQIDAVGIANQRASTLVWERASGRPVGPALGWQDLRTVGTCLAMQAEGFRFPPNASATKLAAILDEVDPRRER